MSDDKMPILKFKESISQQLWIARVLIDKGFFSFEYDYYILQFYNNQYHLNYQHDQDKIDIVIAVVNTLTGAKKIARGHFAKNYIAGRISGEGERQVRREKS